MNKKRFLDLVLGHEGYYCIWANRAAPDREDAEIKQKFYQTVDELIDAAQDLDADGWNTFFALATYEEAGSQSFLGMSRYQYRGSTNLPR
jgi:hypothetical protein